MRFAADPCFFAFVIVAGFAPGVLAVAESDEGPITLLSLSGPGPTSGFFADESKLILASGHEKIVQFSLDRKSGWRMQPVSSEGDGDVVCLKKMGDWGKGVLPNTCLAHCGSKQGDRIDCLTFDSTSRVLALRENILVDNSLKILSVAPLGRDRVLVLKTDGQLRLLTADGNGWSDHRADEPIAKSWTRLLGGESGAVVLSFERREALLMSEGASFFAIQNQVLPDAVFSISSRCQLALLASEGGDGGYVISRRIFAVDRHAADEELLPVSPLSGILAAALLSPDGTALAAVFVRRAGAGSRFCLTLYELAGKPRVTSVWPLDELQARSEKAAGHFSPTIEWAPNARRLAIVNGLARVARLPLHSAPILPFAIVDIPQPSVRK